MSKQKQRSKAIGGASRKKVLEYHLFYASILKEQGYTWEDSLARINRLLELEGKEPYASVTNFRDRVRDFHTKHGGTFVKELQPFLFSTDKIEVMRYLISDLLLQYHEAKLDNNKKQMVSISTKIQEAIWRKHQLEQKEEDDGDDAFTELIKKTLEVDKPKAN